MIKQRHAAKQSEETGCAFYYKSGCPECEEWTESTTPDFGNCPFCGEPKTVWNMTNAEAPTDHELMLEDQIA